MGIKEELKEGAGSELEWRAEGARLDLQDKELEGPAKEARLVLCLPFKEVGEAAATCSPLAHFPMPPFPGDHHPIKGARCRKRRKYRRRWRSRLVSYTRPSSHHWLARALPCIAR